MRLARQQASPQPKPLLLNPRSPLTRRPARQQASPPPLLPFVGRCFFLAVFFFALGGFWSCSRPPSTSDGGAEEILADSSVEVLPERDETLPEPPAEVPVEVPADPRADSLPQEIPPEKKSPEEALPQEEPAPPEPPPPDEPAPPESSPPEPPPELYRCGPGYKKQPKDQKWTLTYTGLKRTFFVHVPPTYDPSRPMPLVLNLHGHSSNALQQNLLSNLNKKADFEGFVAVHPQGTGPLLNSWNAGNCCPPATTRKIDDVAFIRDLIRRVRQNICIDKKRIYAMGMSNGGFMSYRLACELSDQIAAFAPVAGTMVFPNCQPKRPVPILHIHGLSDLVVPFKGNKVMGFPPVEEVIKGWVKRNGCPSTPHQTYKKGEVTCDTYSPCKAGVEVTLCRVKNGGHTWPGGIPVPHLGHTTRDLNATDAIWTFFRQYPLP